MLNLLPPYSAQTWKVIFCVAIPLLILLIVMFTMDKCSTWSGNRDIDKARANVNAALQNVNAQKEVVIGDRVAENRAIEDVKVAANAAIQSSTATDEAKQQANAAVANWEAKKNANLPTGTTEADLQRKLEALDR